MKLAVLCVPLLVLSVASATWVESAEIAGGDEAADQARPLHAVPRVKRASGATQVRAIDGSLVRTAVEMNPSSDLAQFAPEEVAAIFPPVKLSGGGGVGQFGSTPNGVTVVWIERVANIEQLFSRPVDGSAAAVQLTIGLFSAPDVGVTDFEVSPDGSRVVFTGDFLQGFGENSLASVPIGGGAITTLNKANVDEPVSDFAISPDGLKVLYLGIDSLHASGRIDAYTNSITGGVPVQVSTAGLSPHGQADVSFAEFTPDSASVVHAADFAANNRIDLFAGPANAPFNATLSSSLSRVKEVQVGQPRVSYISDDTTLGIDEVYSVLLNGTNKLKLNSSSSGDATNLLRSPDNARVCYRANHDSLAVREAYTAQIAIAASETKVHAPLAAPRNTDSVNFTPNGASVLYRADELTAGEIELFVRPIDLSTPSLRLHDVASGETLGLFDDRGVPVINGRAIYPLFSDKVYLYSVETDGTESALLLSAPPGAGRDLFSAYVPTDQQAKLLAYGVGVISSGAIEKIYSKPIRSGLQPEQFNVTATAGRAGVGDYFINATENYGVYTQDQDVQSRLELYSAQLDSDGDGTANATDTCRFAANSAGGLAPFAQTIVASNKTTFTWPFRTEVRFAQGGSPLSGSYATTLTGTMANAKSVNDLTTPPLGSFTWTLIAPDCPTRDWGNNGRNQILP